MCEHVLSIPSLPLALFLLYINILYRLTSCCNNLFIVTDQNNIIIYTIY